MSAITSYLFATAFIYNLIFAGWVAIPGIYRHADVSWGQDRNRQDGRDDSAKFA